MILGTVTIVYNDIRNYYCVMILETITAPAVAPQKKCNWSRKPLNQKGWKLWVDKEIEIEIYKRKNISNIYNYLNLSGIYLFRAGR